METKETSQAGEQPATPSGEWKEVRFSTEVVTDGPIFVIKLRGKYLRFSTAYPGGALGVNMRLATRFDSATWAKTLAAGFKKAKVVRLFSKAERQGVMSTLWTYKAAVKVDAPPPEPTTTGKDPNAGSRGER